MNSVSRELNVLSKFIDPLRRVFTLPKGAVENEDVFFEAYVEVLKTFPEDALAEAAKRILASRDTRSFPLPAECNHACRDAMESLCLARKREGRPDNRNEQKPVEERYPEWSDRRRRRADELFNCELGRQALKEDWGWTLWDWIRENDRLPDRYEVEKIRAKGLARSKQFWEMVGDKEKVDKSALNSVILQNIKLREQACGKLKKLIA